MPKSEDHLEAVPSVSGAAAEAAEAAEDLALVHEHLPMAVFVIGPDRRVRGANQRACMLFGYGDASPVGLVAGAAMRCLNHLADPRGCGHAPDCRECRLRQSAQRAFESRSSIHDVAATIPADGEQGAVERHLLADFVYVDHPQPGRLLAYVRDVTELRLIEADRALKAAVLDQIEDRVTITDPHGFIRFVNDATCRSLKVRRDQLVGKHVDTLGDDPAADATQQEIVTGTLTQGAWRGEVVNFTASGERVVLDCRTQAIRGAAGQLVALCGISTDITARKLQEERLRESEQRFRRLHEQLPLGYFCLDADGYYCDANPAWLDILGCTRDALHGRHFLGHVAAEQASSYTAALHRLAGGESVQVELTLRRAGGEPVVVFCVGRAEPATTDQTGMLHWVAVDVSERRDLEDQLRQAQKMDALGRLAAGVAHDFNNQLTVMRGYCDLLIDRMGDDEPCQLAARQIRSAAERARATTSQLLAFSRRGAYEPQPVDLNQILEELHHPVAKMIGEAIRIRLEPAPRLPRVEVDPSGLQQALFNLIINARDAQPDGGVIVLRTGRDGPDKVVLEVVDAGCGMDTALVERVWEPFFTTKNAGEGTGLGLTMVKSFVEQSGGSVSLASEPGRGTTVRVVLPAVTRAERSSPDAATVDPQGGRKGRILVVEDDDEVCRVVTSILGRVGHHVTAARGAAEAVELAAASPVPFDLLVADVVMPDMGGEELAALLSARGQIAGVVYMSGYGSPSRDLGDAPLVTKPFSAAQLAGAVAARLVSVVEPMPTDPATALAASVEARP